MKNLPQLKYIREGRALSQRDLAAMSGVAHDTIGQLERGERKARPSTIRKLAEALGVTPSGLLAEPETAAWLEMDRIRTNQGQKPGVQKLDTSTSEKSAAPTQGFVRMIRADAKRRAREAAWEAAGKWAEYYVSGQAAADLPEPELLYSDWSGEADERMVLSEIEAKIEETFLRNALQLPRGTDAEELNIARLKLNSEDLKETADVAQRTLRSARETMEKLRIKQTSFEAIPEHYFKDPVSRHRIEVLDKALQRYRKQAVEAAQKLLDLHAEALLCLEDEIHDMREEGEKIAVLTRRSESRRYDKRES